MIADFGLAKAMGDETLTADGTLLGTPEFMAPEQINGDAADERSDLFSLGVVLYTASTGVSPFRAESPLLTLDRIRVHEPMPLAEMDATLPEWFCAVVDRLLAKDPRERIQSASELAEELGSGAGSATVANRLVGEATQRVTARRKASSRAAGRWRKLPDRGGGCVGSGWCWCLVVLAARRFCDQGGGRKPRGGIFDCGQRSRVRTRWPRR